MVFIVSSDIRTIKVHWDIAFMITITQHYVRTTNIHKLLLCFYVDSLSKTRLLSEFKIALLTWHYGYLIATQNQEC